LRKAAFPFSFFLFVLDYPRSAFELPSHLPPVTRPLYMRILNYIGVARIYYDKRANEVIETIG